MKSPRRRIDLLRRLAWCCAALVLVVTGMSAFLRLTKAGLGCEPWPQCHALGADRGTAAQTGTAAADAGHATAAARLAHRVAASAALVLALVMAMIALPERAFARQLRWLSLGILALVVFLAVLGRWSAAPRVPAVTVGNLLGGNALFALACQLARAAGQGVMPAGATSGAAWPWLGAALVAGQIALGGLVSANHAGAACPQWLGCEVAGASWRALDPWRDLAAGPLSAADAAWLQEVHRAVGVVTAAVLLPLALRARARDPRGSMALLVLLALQGAAGLVMVRWGLPMAAAMAHNLLATGLLAAVTGLAAGVAPPAGAGPGDG